MNIIEVQALWRFPLEIPQNVQDEATYISENFGVTLATAVEIALSKIRKKKRVDRK
jgi:antitoxin component of RelBE/YafQ-DinJ toxin-antitoxin module